MKTRKIIGHVILGVLMVVAILIDININWWWRGYLAFGGESLLYLIAIGFYIRMLLKEYVL